MNYKNSVIAVILCGGLMFGQGWAMDLGRQPGQRLSPEALEANLNALADRLKVLPKITQQQVGNNPKLFISSFQQLVANKERLFELGKTMTGNEGIYNLWQQYDDRLNDDAEVIAEYFAKARTSNDEVFNYFKVAKIRDYFYLFLWDQLQEEAIRFDKNGLPQDDNYFNKFNNYLIYLEQNNFNEDQIKWYKNVLDAQAIVAIVDDSKKLSQEQKNYFRFNACLLNYLKPYCEWQEKLDNLKRTMIEADKIEENLDLLSAFERKIEQLLNDLPEEAFYNEGGPLVLARDNIEDLRKIMLENIASQQQQQSIEEEPEGQAPVVTKSHVQANAPQMKQKQPKEDIAALVGNALKAAGSLQPKVAEKPSSEPDVAVDGPNPNVVVPREENLADEGPPNVHISFITGIINNVLSGAKYFMGILLMSAGFYWLWDKLLGEEKING